MASVPATSITTSNSSSEAPVDTGLARSPAWAAMAGPDAQAWKASSEPWLEAAEGMARFQANDRAGNLAHALEAIEARSELPDTVVAQGLAGQAKGWNSVALVRLFGEGTAATQRRILQDLRDNFSPTGRVALRGAFLDVVWRADKQDAGLSAAHEKRVLGSLLTRANDRLTASSVVARILMRLLSVLDPRSSRLTASARNSPSESQRR